VQHEFLVTSGDQCADGRDGVELDRVARGADRGLGRVLAVAVAAEAFLSFLLVFKRVLSEICSLDTLLPSTPKERPHFSPVSMNSTVFILEPSGGGATTASEEDLPAAAARGEEGLGRGIDFSMHRSSPSFILLLLFLLRGESGSSERSLPRAEKGG
jgi:hypothetical protein